MVRNDEYAGRSDGFMGQGRSWGGYLHRAHTARAPCHVLEQTMGKGSFLGPLVA